MPKVEIEIMRTVTVTREESVVIELDVPKRVLDDEEVDSWVDNLMDRDDDKALIGREKANYQAVKDAEWDVNDEDESIQYDEAYAVQ